MVSVPARVWVVVMRLGRFELGAFPNIWINAFFYEVRNQVP